MKSILHLKFIVLYIIFGFLCVFTTATLTNELIMDRLEEDISQSLYREATLISNNYLPSYFSEDSSIWAVQSQLIAMRLYLNSSLWFVAPDGSLITSSNIRGTTAPRTIENFDPAEIGNSQYITGTYHDYFDEGLFGRYMGEFPGKLGISWQDFIDMGRENPGSNEKFSMSVFALNTCQEANGVSWLHGKVSQRMFAPVWKGYFPDELHVGYVTNGVHMPTWAATEVKKFYADKLGTKLFEDQSNRKCWEGIQNVSDEEIWNLRMTLKNKLIDYIRVQYKDSWLKNQGDPSKVVSILEKINPNALLIGFGRRFATYKRAHLLFTDLDRLAKIVNNEKFPIQFVFTGKAHPADGGGQGLIKHIVEISRRPEFLGKIIFLENYDMRLARHLIAGVDVWLNTPTRPLEASGTSGEKAEMNGVLNFSVLDGWWYEGYKQGAGWALTDKRTYENQQYQDQLDAATIYHCLETEIIPTYYAKNSKGYSPDWIQYIKNSIAKIVPDYTMKRMLDDYVRC
jgi:starch phosphorylase